MIKYFEVPDLHFDPSWYELTEKVIDKIILEGKKQEIDFVSLPGDITNRALYASDQGGINQLRGLIKRLTSNFPTCAIYGTPGHEPPGSLEHLKDCGLVILKPNNVYGFFKRENKIKLISQGDPLDLSCVLFGIPELNKKRVQAHYKLSAEEANAKTLDQFEKYINEYVAPMRMKYNDVPAIGLLHGVVSDSRQENETDIIKKSSSMLIHTEILDRANLDRWTLGDIHTPWESKNICAGYAGFTGIDSNPWGKTGFEPACNMVELERIMGDEFPSGSSSVHIKKPLITRIPYGTPKRLKITQPSQAENQEVAYWLHSTDPEAKLPENVHPWSRVTHNSEKRETQRVTAEEAKTIKTLSDLFVLIDPKVSKRILSKVNTMESEIGETSHKKIDAVLEEVEIVGCDFFDGKTVKFNTSCISNNLFNIRGPNESGKSAMLSFWSWFPCIIGKETDSGRTSAIKDFFHYPNAQIKKSGHVNGIAHDHVINIKGSHTSTTKVECSLHIDGKPQLDKGSFDEMFNMCEEIYGSFSDYLLTSFYIQPGQSHKNKNLADASITEIRNLVQSIAGVNRDKEKKHALDKASEIKKEIEKLNNWLSGVSEFQIDVEEIEKELKKFMLEETDLNSKISDLKIKLKSSEFDYKNTLEKKSLSDSEEKRKKDDESKISSLKSSIELKKTMIAELEESSNSLQDNVKKLNQNTEIVKQNDLIKKIIQENADLKRDYDIKVQDEARKVKQLNEDAERDYKREYSFLNQTIELCKNQNKEYSEHIELINNPCEKCGHIKSNVKEEIKLYETKIETNKGQINTSEKQLLSLTEPTPQFPEPITQPIYKSHENQTPELTQQQVKALESLIESGRDAKVRIQSAQENIDQSQKTIDELNLKTYKIIQGLNIELQKIENTKAGIDFNINNQNQDLIRVVSNIKTSEDKIEKSKGISSKIETTNKEIKSLSTDLEDWDYIAKMLQASKIPALELDIVIESIDAEATRIIKPFLESRYSFETITQDQGKSGTVDRFDIIVHDSEKGIGKSFLKHSPGGKAFLADAYTKSLIKKRNERLHRRYDPIIMDESDGPIDPDRISMYYDIQKQYWTENKVLIVSHNPTSHEYIDQSININDLKEKL